ncbi:hypothetical protein M0805_002490 [Coniferiporia weirii]|nr:hypothetical protein M0805_002490 [Coniferiporia weirii]
MSFITAQDLIEAAGLAGDEATLQSEATLEMPERDELELMKARGLGMAMTRPQEEQEILYCELAAKHLPRLTAAFRRDTAPNSAAMTLINMVTATPYFMHFIRTPAGEGLHVLQAQRMINGTLIRSDTMQDVVAEACQFLSTLLVLCGRDVVSGADRTTLLSRLRAWYAQYRGQFAEQTSGRCIDILDPQGAAGAEMMMMVSMMKMKLMKGVDVCMAENCRISSEGNGRELLQCGRCKSIRYCGVEHQRQDWARHRNLCFSPAY